VCARSKPLSPRMTKPPRSWCYDVGLLLAGICIGALGNCQLVWHSWTAGVQPAPGELNVPPLHPPLRRHRQLLELPPASASAGGGVHATADALYATLHVAHLNDGVVQVPSRTRRIIMEVGCSDRDTMDNDELNKPLLNDTFLISFEPLLDKYATLLARGNVRFNGRLSTDRAVPLGHHHPRGVVLPFAVTPHARRHGLASINVSRIAGCSSLVPFNENTTWGSQCFTDARGGGMFEQRLVPAISISNALALAPAHLPIAKLKLDAQGLDFKMLRAAGGAALARVQELELEVVRETCTTLYQGQETHLQVNAHLHSLGFVVKAWRWHGHFKCEGTGFFIRRKAAEPSNTP